MTEPADPVDTLLTTKQVASLFAISDRLVRIWVNQGMPQHARNKYRLSAIVQWRCEKLRRATDQTGTLAEEKHKLVKAQRDLKELEAAKQRSELLDAELVAQTITEMAGAFATQLDGLPARLAAKLAQIDDPSIAQSVLRDECQHVRRAASAAAAAIGSDVGSGEDSRPAAKKKRRRVGGRKPGASAGKPGARAVAD